MANITEYLGIIICIALFILSIVGNIQRVKKRTKAEKQKGEFSDYLKKDEKFANSKLFAFETESLIQISESGFVAMKTKDADEIYIVHISKINGFEILTNGTSSVSISRAVAGGFLFGAAGAIIGGQSQEEITSIKLLVKLDDFNKPTVILPLYNNSAGMKKGSSALMQFEEETKELTATLELIDKRFKGRPW
jgi:hypothetical protein